MRRTLISLVALAGAASVGFARVGNEEPTEERSMATVDVNVRCAGNRIFVAVSPWVIQAQRGDEVVWNLNANGNGNSVVVTPKAGWPFQNRRITGGRGNPARSGPSQQAGRYQYLISVQCQQGNNPPVTVDIDPDVIITL